MQNQETQAYKWKEHIRKRPAMYIGDLHLNGFKQMLEYLFEELLADCLAYPIFEIEFHPNTKVTIRINNIDTQKFLLRLDELEATSDGLSSLGLGVFITLSADISITTSKEKENNIIIDYTADKEVFKNFELIYEHINSFLRQLAFLNPTLKIISIDKTSDELQRNVFYYPTGVFKQLDYFVSQLPYGKPLLRLDIAARVGDFSYKIGICYSDIWLDKSFIKTYAGNIETYLGGSLNDGIFDGLILSIKTLAQKENADILITKKLAMEQLLLIAAVKGENLMFEGSTKRKLGMPHLRKDVKKIVFNQLTSYFQTNPVAASNILQKFRRRD